MNDLRTRLQAALGGAYTLERELGGGGMSRVFLAQETALGRAVVVKLVPPELLAGVSAERFAREVKLAARLQHANIVPVLTAGQAGDLPYYTMPFVRGESLRARLAAGTPLPLSESVSLLRDVARALACAHAEGIVHRDIKPENILLSGGAAVVTDFGIAKALTESRATQPGENEGLTQVGHAIGTPAYMAPEQAVGGDVDHRADIYAWGVIAWELLAGRHPFAGREGAQRLITAHLTEPPPPLPEEVPPVLADLVRQALEKDPAHRPASAEALVAGLSVIGTPTAERFARSTAAPRSRRRWSLVAAGLVLLGVAAVFGWRVGRSAGTSRSVVVLPFENLGAAGDAYFAEGMSDEIASQLARIPGLQVVARASVERFRGSGRAPHEIAREVGAGFALSGTVRWAHAGNTRTGDTEVRIVPALVSQRGDQVWGEPFQEQLTDVFRVQADVAERVAAALSVRLGPAEAVALRQQDSRDPEARDALLLGRSLLRQRGLDNLRRAVTEFRRAIGRDSGYARAWAGYAEAYGYLPAYFDSTVRWDESLAESERAARRAAALDSLLPEAHLALATALFHGVRLQAALTSVDRAIQLDPSAAMAQKLRGEVLLAQGRVQDAEVPLRRALALDPLVPVHHANLGLWFVADGQLDSAAASMQRASQLDSANALWHYALAFVRAHQGQADAAVEECVAFGAPEPTCRTIWGGALEPARRPALVQLLGELGRDPARVPWFPPAFQAIAYAKIGETDSAFARLRLALVPGNYEFHGLINAPWFASLRTDPRWDAVVGTMQRQ
ncbi:MAG: protein kinase [Gemmatimonadales bacterium]